MSTQDGQKQYESEYRRMRKYSQGNVNMLIIELALEKYFLSENKDLLNANDRYIDLSIGNAAWPMGLTMVGIHQRTGKSSISPAQVAYILNDEITKKYLQSIRRILSFLQISAPQPTTAL